MNQRGEASGNTGRARTYSRRQFLGTSAAALAGAGLAAGRAATAGPGTASAAPPAGGIKKGGTFSGYLAANPPSLDPYASVSEGGSEFTAYAYSRLYMLKSGPGAPKGSIEVVPDAAESHTVSSDGLTYTIKLRSTVRFHPPLNRTMTAEDVVVSWERLNGRLKGTSPSPRLVNVDMIKSVTATGPLTVAFTLKAPYPFFLGRLADPKAFPLMPKEAATEFNPAEKVVGSGPWVLEQYTPNTVVKFKRHPGWHLGPDLPYYDGVTLSVIPTYATQLSQFLAGHIDMLVIDGNDLKKARDALPGVQFYQTPSYPLSVLNFSPHEPRWNDPRLRHAVSMAMNRDGMLDAAYSLKQVELQGFAVQHIWHNYIPAAFTAYWLDPKGPEIHPNVAAYFKHNTAEAKKLVDAAGGAFDTEFHFAAANSRYGEAYRIIADLLIQYLRQVGINARAVEEDYNAVFIPQTAQGGKFNGMMYIPQTRTDPFAYFQTQYLSPKQPIYGRWVDPPLTRRLEKIQTLLDPGELRREIRSLQNELGEKMYVVPMQYGAAPSFIAYQPYVRNALDYQTLAQGGATENLPHYWSNR
jgi:ABC-type transport system substrate-binding protein